MVSVFCQPNRADRFMLDGVKPVIQIATIALYAAACAFGQDTPASSESSDSGTSNDLFVMFGSDLVRPGLLPKANYNIGLGHTFKFLHRDPIGDEITFAYTYENAGSHGFLHTDFGSHTEALGLMKNFPIPGTKRVTGFRAALPASRETLLCRIGSTMANPSARSSISTIAMLSGFKKPITKLFPSRGTPRPASDTRAAGSVPQRLCALPSPQIHRGISAPGSPALGREPRLGP